MTDIRISGATSGSESDIRMNYGDPSKIIAAANNLSASAQAQFFSIDGGATWNQNTLSLNAGDDFQSDPAVDWTSDGTAWAITLGVVASTLSIRARCFSSPDNGATWNFDSTPTGASTGVDREIMWVDHSPTSPFKDRMYLTWHEGLPVFVASRPLGGAWSAKVQVSGAETVTFGIGGDIKTNSFGDVFVFWPDADGSGNIVVAKSTDGGGVFGAPVIIANTFATQRALAIPADNIRRARVYTSGGAYRTAAKDLVYVVWSDLTGAAGCTTGGGPGSSVASTCKTRVWFSRSTNGGADWSAPEMLNNQASLNDQFHSKLCVDESNGNLMVTYHDTVGDAGRLESDIWMQTSTDDGVTWSAAVRVTSARTDETAAAANSFQYGDYDGLTGFYGTFFPCWTDRRSGGSEEIWTSRLNLIEQQCYFIVDKSTFGQDEVDAMLLLGNSTVNAAFYVVVEGFTATDLGITAGDLVGAPAAKPVLTSVPAVAGMTIGEPTALIAEDATLPATPQRFTWVYPVSFISSAGFTAAVINVTLNATMSSVSGVAQIQLLQQPNPYELDGPTTWLSTDLRVFRIKDGESKFNATVNGSTPTAAINFIREVLTNLNPGGNSGGQTFENDISTDQSASTLALNQTAPGGTAIFNYAIAKVRYQALVQDAQTVRVSFRLCPALTVSTIYDANDPTPAVSHAVGNVYRRFTDGVQSGHSIALLGTTNNNILTIPCFATVRTSGDMTAQQDTPNVQTLVHDATGAEIDHYFGCWLDINQPTSTWYPLNPTSDGPFGGTLKSILELVRNAHQCLLSEIVFDPDPIPNGVSAGSSDKIAQRNLAVTTSANPGDQGSRRIPNTFELKPTPFARGTDPYDELMILWGNVPAGSVARIYLPEVSADDILEMARKRYLLPKLTRLDNHTLESPCDGITYVPIPSGSSVNYTGLLTIDLPEGVRKDQSFQVVVRQFTNTGQKAPLNVTVATTAGTLASWKKVVGTFQVSIPVSVKNAMLEPEIRLLSILRWILLSIPRHDRWYPVFSRYVEEIGDRVNGLGGNSHEVFPSPNGDGFKSPCDHRTKWLLPAVLAFLLVFIALAPLLWTGPIAAFALVLVLAIACYWYWRCKPSRCDYIGALLLGISVANLILGLIVAFGYRSLASLLMLALLGILGGILVIISVLRGCCWGCMGRKDAQP